MYHSKSLKIFLIIATASLFGNTPLINASLASTSRYGLVDYEPEIGLYNNRLRYYDPETGTFITKDPIGVQGGLNTYQYVSSNPVNGVDPSGKIGPGAAILIPVWNAIVGFWNAQKIYLGIASIMTAVGLGNLEITNQTLGVETTWEDRLGTAAGTFTTTYASTRMGTFPSVFLGSTVQHGSVELADLAVGNTSLSGVTTRDTVNFAWDIAQTGTFDFFTGKITSFAGSKVLNSVSDSTKWDLAGFQANAWHDITNWTGKVSGISARLLDGIKPTFLLHGNESYDPGVYVKGIERFGRSLFGGIADGVTGDTIFDAAYDYLSNVDLRPNGTGITGVSGRNARNFTIRSAAQVVSQNQNTTDVTLLLNDLKDFELYKFGIGDLDLISNVKNQGPTQPNYIDMTPTQIEKLAPPPKPVDAQNNQKVSSFGNATNGGVLIDKAAELIGSTLSDIKGATFDPISNQLIFLGNDHSTSLEPIDLDYFFTAIKAVYGSAIPPSVSLDPPAFPYTHWNNLGNENNVLEPGESGEFMLRYHPVWQNEDTTMDVKIRGQSAGTPFEWEAHLNAIAFDSRSFPFPSDGGFVTQLAFDSWTSPPPAGVTLDTAPFVSDTIAVFPNLSDSGRQDSFYRFRLFNNSSKNYVVENISVFPARQHRRFGGRVENTKLGWVMYEADRVMKCLSIGKDNLTGADYNRTTVPVAGYQNLVERLHTLQSSSQSNFFRMWFVPDEMTLKRHVDSSTGQATIVFDRATVALLTESYLRGLPQNPSALAFAQHFNEHYDDFAKLTFPVEDPNDPTGENIIEVRIFEMLREVMQAVSLARFMRDNEIPVDFWWLDSWSPQAVHIPKSTPTAMNKSEGIVIYGGININKRNDYIPSETARTVGRQICSARPEDPADSEGDVAAQTWTSGTEAGNMKAAALSQDTSLQDGNYYSNETDLCFPSPGALPLAFTRYYNSEYMAKGPLGPGWQMTRFALEFSRPSWFDENGLMRDGLGKRIKADAAGDTRLRSGVLRVVDRLTGEVLDFVSSLQVESETTSQGDTIIQTSGLTSVGVPYFTFGRIAHSALLYQNPTSDKGYVFTTQNGTCVEFDYEGRVLKTRDVDAFEQIYTYDENGLLQNITDARSQQIHFYYHPNGKLAYITGPHEERIDYGYDEKACLQTCTHEKSGSIVGYRYNSNCQLIGKDSFNATRTSEITSDLKGRLAQTYDIKRNETVQSFSKDRLTGERTSVSTFSTFSHPNEEITTTKKFDDQGRLASLERENGTGLQVEYDKDSLYPNRYKVLGADLAPTEVSRDFLGRVSTVATHSKSGDYQTEVTRDPNTGYVRQVCGSDGSVQQFDYDATSRVKCIRSFHKGQTVETLLGHESTQNGGKIETLTTPEKNVATIKSDAFDRVTAITDPNGVTVSYEYDDLGRLWKVDDPRYSEKIVYLYDEFNRVKEIQTPVGNILYTYDPISGFLTKVQDALGRVTEYEYDPDTGEVLGVIRGGNYTALEYDDLGGISKLTLDGGNPIEFHRDAHGLLTGITENNGSGPGMPKSLMSDRATDGVYTISHNQTFTWGAPDSDVTVAGYSYALDVLPGETQNIASTTASLADVSNGKHTFQVRAMDADGHWGPPAIFNLWIDDSGYDLGADAPGNLGRQVHRHLHHLIKEGATETDIARDRADFNGDGKTDLLIKNGLNDFWLVTDAGSTALFDDYEDSLANLEWGLGDFDGDGKTDLITALPTDNDSASEYWVTPGSGSERYLLQRHGVNLSDSQWGLGDFNGDHRTDLIVVNQNNDYYVTTHPGNGFIFATFEGLANEHQWGLGDFDNDGKTDLLVSNHSNEFWAVMGTGGSERQTAKPYTIHQSGYFPEGNWWESAWGLEDVDGDGATDLIVATADNHYWVVPFAKAEYPYASFYETCGMLHESQWGLGDFNGDKKIDLIVVGAQDNTYWISTDPGGEVSKFQSEGGALREQQWGLDDFDGDKKTDLIVAYKDNSYWLSASGSAQTGAYLFKGSDGSLEKHRWDLCDFNGDKKADLIIFNTENRNFTLTFEEGAPGPHANRMSKIYEGNGKGLMGNEWSVRASAVRVGPAYAQSEWIALDALSQKMSDVENECDKIQNEGKTVLGFRNTQTAGNPLEHLKCMELTENLPPEAPKTLRSNNAADSVYARTHDHVFQWEIPDSAATVAGYSYALDGTPDEIQDTTSTNALLTGVSNGKHTFQVTAVDESGKWGPPAVFNLWIDDTKYELGSRLSGERGRDLHQHLLKKFVDFNNDGKSDLIMVDSEDNFWTSTGQGGWSLLQPRVEGMGNYQWGLGDFDGDGITDLLVVTTRNDYWVTNGETKNRYLFFDGGGTLEQHEWGLGDFNADGRTDLIIANYMNDFWVKEAGEKEIYSFQKHEGRLASHQWGLGDFDGDGKCDLMVATPQNDYWVTTSATKQKTLFFDGGGRLVDHQWALGDFDGDGKNDLILVNQQNDYWVKEADGRSVYLYQNHGGHLPDHQWGLGDFNGDNITDLIVANRNNDYWVNTEREHPFLYENHEGKLSNVEWKLGDREGNGKSSLFVLDKRMDWNLGTFDGSRKTEVILFSHEDGIFRVMTNSNTTYVYQGNDEALQVAQWTVQTERK